jgi:hypothetical protein
MLSYTIPKDVTKRFFYPYINNQKVNEDVLMNDFPKTYEYLKSNKIFLASRTSIINEERAWWEPVRPRPPINMMRPKIISPHLALMPRFSLDSKGEYGISHSPLLYPKEEFAESDLLNFFLAILNSTVCFWYISTHSHLYQRGYIMLEPKTLKVTPVPDPTMVPRDLLRRILSLVDKRMVLAGSERFDVEKEIDSIVAELYNLSSKERRLLGIDI